MSPVMTDLKRLIKHSGVYLVGNILNRGGSFLLLPIYTKYLNVTEYGALELIYSFVLAASTFLSAGLSHATLRFYFDYEDIKDRHEVIITNFIGTFAIGLLGCFILLLCIDKVSFLLFGSFEYKNALMFCLMIIILSITSEVFLAYLRAIEYSWQYVGVSIVKLIMQICMTYYMLIEKGRGVSGVIEANFYSVLVVWIILFVFSVRSCGFSIDAKKLRPIMSYSFPFFISSIIGVVATNIDKFILMHYMSLADVGIYGLGLKFGLVLILVLSEPFNRAYGAYRFSIIENDNAKEIQALVLKYICALAVFVGLGISLLSVDVIEIMADRSYWNASYIVPLIVLGNIFLTMSYCFQTGILYRKKTSYMLYISILSLVLSILFNILLVREYGALGAALSFVLVRFVTAVVTNLMSQKVYKIKYDTLALTGFVIAGISLYFINELFNTFNSPISIVLKLVTAFAFIVLIAGFDKDIIMLISKVVKKLRFNKSIAA